MPSAPAGFACCDRCATLGTTPPDGLTGRPSVTSSESTIPAIASTLGAQAMVARRRLLKTAVSRRASETGETARKRAVPGSEPASPAGQQSAGQAHAAGSPPVTGAEQMQPGAAGDRSGFADVDQLPRTVAGAVVDVSPHVLVLGGPDFEQRFVMTPDAIAWRGRQLEPALLRQGDNVVVRLHPGHRDVADRIWANIGRVTGVIAERSGSTLIVDEGATRGPQAITLHPPALGRIQVRFPTLEPGYLIDIIGLRDGDELIGMIPATSQPGYPADRLPAAPLVSGHVARTISGSATWHEPRDEPPGVLGVHYPALDPETGCAEEAVTGIRQGYARLPYLAIGSVLRIRNDCTDSDCLVPVTGCASIARLFNDRCVTCNTSPRGRIADLTLASFIALGGELERGCFNTTVTIGE